MYEFYFNRVAATSELTELVRMFLPSSSFQVLGEDLVEKGNGSRTYCRIPDRIVDTDQGKRYLYDFLSERTGKKLDWGILTGVRPVKLTADLIQRKGDATGARVALVKDYYVTPKKIDLLFETLDVQRQMVIRKDLKTIALYVGIPFCPTRCMYCSFPSYAIKGARVSDYMEALMKEIRFVGEKLSASSTSPESLYIGGGTPTSISADQLQILLSSLSQHINLKKLQEYTIEAGRPDTITPEKLAVMRQYGAGRISINSQSMNETTLKRIGRNHDSNQVREAFSMARRQGFDAINTDVIAGLPGEEEEAFIDSLGQVIALEPENITVHTLAVKRGSELAKMDEEYSYHQGERVGKMVFRARELLKENGYRPYYLYRQKQSVGNHENVGYARPGKESIYNIRIMEENQTIVALGAGASSKRWYPEENRLERVFNVSNYEIYIERIEEMLLRKEVVLFNDQEEITCQNC